MEENKYDNALTKLYESLEPIEDKDRLDEGAWETIKYGLSKLGRYKAGGKIIGKNKVTKAAERKIRDILNKETNKLLRGLDSEVNKAAPEFPNDKKRVTFLRGIITIGALYDSIVAATKKKEGQEGYLPVDAANDIIADMREYVKKFLDVDLAGVYTTMESEENKGNVLTEEEQEILKYDVLTEEEVYLLSEKGFLGKVGKAIGKVGKGITRAKDKVMDKAFGAKKGSDKPAKGGSGQSAKFQKSSGSGEFESDRMGKKGLASNRLPIILNMVGGAMGAYSWLANTEWFKSLFTEEITYTDTEQVTEMIETKSQVLNDIKPGEGLYKGLSRVTDIEVNPSSSPEKFIQQMSQIGGGDPHKGVDLLCQKGGWMMKPGEASKGLHGLVNNPNSVDNMGEFFSGEASGTGKLVDPNSGLNTTLYGTKAGTTLTSLLVKRLPVVITKAVTKTAVKTGAAYYTAKGLGKILGPIGLALVLAGATVKVLREKGQRQSRAKTLDDLLQSLKDIKPTDGNEPIINEPTGEVDEPQGDEQEGKTPPPIPPSVPTDFLQGNRNMQLAYLSSNFLPQGEDFWSKLGLKKGTVIPSGFLDAALQQGKPKSDKYLRAFYKHLKKNNSFEKDVDEDKWVNTVVKESDNLALIKWVRNTRKGIGSFVTKLKKAFPEFEIGERQKAKSMKPGERGKAMGLAGESIKGRTDLILEIGLGKVAGEAGFNEKLFMKNLPQFMEMLSTMYFGKKSGSGLPYNKEAVFKVCKKYGCDVSGSGKKYKRKKSDDYRFMMTDKIETIQEEITRIRQLMK